MRKTPITILCILLFTFTINSQNTFELLWTDVNKFEVDNLPKSALKVVQTIYSKATKEGNSPQLIKSLFYKSKFSLTLEEDAQLKIIHQFKHHISKSTFPTKNVLEGVLANLYWQYFTKNRYKFYNRTSTKNKVNSYDFRTWDLNTLFKEIHLHFKASLKEEAKLQQTPITTFSDILQLHKDAQTYTPTLYDFLVNNALSFYKSSETSITRPSHKFIIEDPNYIKNTNLFSNLEITSKDSISLQLHALKAYQKLIIFHLKANNKDALALINIERLHFVRRNATFKNKEKLFLETLEKASKTNANHVSSGLYIFEIAKIKQQKATNYKNFKEEKESYQNREALQLCKNILRKFPKSLGAQKCAILKAKILDTSLSIRAEKYIPINTNSRVLISYKNIDTLYFKVYKITAAQQLSFQKIYKIEARISFLKKLEKSTEWIANLRNENDYLRHTTEVIVPKLAGGLYLILASEKATITATTIHGTTSLQATNLVLVTNTFNETYNYQIVDRNNGKPIKNASLFLQNERKNRGKLINKKLITNKNGFASFKSANYYNDVLITVKTKNDKAIFGKSYVYDQETKDTGIRKKYATIKPFIFTDRSIYRPGQTVYFKAILIKQKGTNSEIYKDEFVAVTLTDVNRQEVKTLDIKLNEFGSIAGEFIIPNNGLTGEYSIKIAESLEEDSTNYFEFSYNNSTTISVEEYKRPKFKTAFKSIIESIRLNDTIAVKGFAKAFSGANITAAKVVYRVQRKVQYPSWYYWRKPNYNAESQEITNGETVSDSAGNFTILFKAMPDARVSKENLPIFSYEITADVTDINGETRSATTFIKVGYHALIASVSINENVDKNQEENSLNIDTKNLNGEFIAAKGTVKIYKLQAPNNPLRDRPWPAPEYQDISEEQFRNLFPHDAYTENDAKNWKQGTLVISENFDTANATIFSLKNIKKWISGKYIAVLDSKDKFGHPVKAKQKFNVFSGEDKKVADKKLFVIQTDKKSYKVDDLIKLKIGSASNDMTVVVQIEKNHTIIKSYFVKLNDNFKTITIPVTKNDIDGFAIKYSFVNYNSFKAGSMRIDVVEKPKSILEIETNIFRDKLQPGAKETWSFTIKNDKNDQIAAEMLASMYDASLDEFKSHNWQFNPITKKRKYSSYKTSAANNSFGIQYFYIENNRRNDTSFPSIKHASYNWFGFYFETNNQMYLRDSSIRKKGISTGIQMNADETALNEVILTTYNKATPPPPTPQAIALFETKKEQEKISLDGITARKNFQETAFFFPQLRTGKTGKVRFSFTMPEALTRWKLQLLAHTTDLKSSLKTLETVTQKKLMVVPNVPRFLREGDAITISAKITNLTNNRLSGFSKLILTDAITGKEIDTLFENLSAVKNFSVDTDGNTSVSWNLSIPETVQAIQYKIVAKAGDFSDGEQNVLPILSNRMLVTETLPMWIRTKETKSFTLDKLKNNTSTTLKNHKLTLEMTSNPVWYAIQSLPYLMEYPYACAEQTFSRYYANALASFVANSNPRIQEVFNIWKSSDALLSNLEKNKELKSLIIQETPWLRDAQTETEQKKRIALLFDLNKMKNEQEKALLKLEDIQLNSGGFPWFKGGRYENNFITQHIAIGFGHLQKLGVKAFDSSTKTVIKKAVKYLDLQFLEHYHKLLEKATKVAKEKGNKKYIAYLAKNHLNYFAIQYLYMRSFYADISMDKETTKAVTYYTNQSEKYWNTYNLYAKGQLALALFRTDKKVVANKILKSLKENSITSDELGMYWKSNTAGYKYYQAPIETHALLIEVFSELEKNPETIDHLKIWLLKNKQTNSWKTTKATTEAIYALLLNGTDWVSITEMVAIEVGRKEINPTKLENAQIESGTGYFKTSWNSTEITPQMSEVTIVKKGDGIAWGSLYWQYFEDLDKITSAATPLKLNKKLFLKTNTSTGRELQEITDQTKLKIGDLITVRIEIRSEKTMEFIHMKDMRASGVEPINVISKYKWQDNLGYYESTKDAATHFFFSRIPKGTFIFEYDVRVNNAGNFSNGITTIKSMYAPEFNSYSKGTRLFIQKK
jgi:uncharacterized protein YfaS (alpha-2-macroglobulin family)